MLLVFDPTDECGGQSVERDVQTFHADDTSDGVGAGTPPHTPSVLLGPRRGLLGEDP